MTCEHRELSHTYRPSTGRNDGPRLSPGCDCEGED